jgi:hypothetical protein
MLPLGQQFCRFATLPRWQLEGQNRHFCRKSRFAESAAKVPETRFHGFGSFIN